MKKLLLTLLLLFSLGGLAKAGTVTYTVTGGTSSGSGSNSTCTYDVSPSGITAVAVKNSGTNAPIYSSNVNTGVGARIYAKGTLTVTSTSDEPMTKIVFNLNSQGVSRQAELTPSSGTVEQTKGGSIITWTKVDGETSVSFTVGDQAIYTNDPSKGGQLCFGTLVVTTDEGSSSNVEITAATGETEYKIGETNWVEKGTEVTFTVEGADSFTYTIDGTPTTLADGKFTINKNTTVVIDADDIKAIYNFAVIEKFTPAGHYWKQIIDVSTLREDDVLIIANAEHNVAMSNQDNSKEFVPQIDVIIANGVLVFNGNNNEECPLTVKLEAADTHPDIPWLLKTENYNGEGGYLTATSNDSNKDYLEVGDADDLTILINDGDALIDFNGHTHNILAYNATQSETEGYRFSCYTLGDVEDTDEYKAVQLYRLTKNDETRIIIAATIGEGDDMVTVSPGTSHDVAVGTVVDFSVKYNDGTEFDGDIEPEGVTISDGKGSLTITENTTVSIIVNTEDFIKEVIYNFIVRPTFTLEDGTEVLYYTVSEALQAIADDYTPTINVKGVIKGIKEVNTTYKNAEYYIADDISSEDELTVYRGKWLNGADFESADQIVVGAEVIVHGQIFNYSGNKPEFAQDNYLLYYYKAPFTPESYAWLRVDDATTLQAGDKLIVATTEADGVAMSATDNGQSKFFGCCNNITITENRLELSNPNKAEEPLVIILQTTGDNKWQLLTTNYTGGNGYLNSTGDKILHVESNASDATIEIIDQNAKISWNGGTNTIQYNSTDPRFTTYSSSQKPVQLYRLTAVPTLKTEVVVDHNHDMKNGVITVEFNFGVINHSGEPEHHYVTLYDANGKIECETVKDLKNEIMSAPRRAEVELPEGVTIVKGKFGFWDEALKTTVPTTIRIESHIGNHNVVNTTYTVADGGIATGIQEVETEGAEAEYYNLQGMRVSHPVAGQLYIKRQGNRVSKVKF